jgi:hypothetical protein
MSIDHSKISQKIKDLFDVYKDNGINSIGLGYKTIGGVETDQLSLVFGVGEKLSISSLSAEQIVPQSISIDNNFSLPTDVITLQKPSFISDCFSANDASSSQHRIKHRPLVGGISMGYPVGEGYVGTLGGIFRDKDDGSLVALTNAHVCLGGLERGIINSSQTSFGFSIQNRYILQTNESAKNTADIIGHIKRYYPINTSKSNEVDCGLIGLNNSSLLDTLTSFKQLGLDNPSVLPIATTSEIDNLLIGPKLIIKSGRSSGFIGGSPPGPTPCPIITKQLHVSSSVNSISKTFNFSDLISIRYQDTVYSLYNGASHLVGQANVSVPGDSGSIVTAYIDNQYKIIALLFAGGSEFPSSSRPYIQNNVGLLCRIDKVLDKLNIEQWDASSITVNPSSNWEFITEPGLSSDINIIRSGKKYWQAGTTSGEDSVYVTYTSSGPSPTSTGVPPAATQTPTATGPTPTPTLAPPNPTATPIPPTPSATPIYNLPCGLYGWGSDNIGDGIVDSITNWYPTQIKNAIDGIGKEVSIPEIKDLDGHQTKAILTCDNKIYGLFAGQFKNPTNNPKNLPYLLSSQTNWIDYSYSINILYFLNTNGIIYYHDPSVLSSYLGPDEHLSTIFISSSDIPNKITQIAGTLFSNILYAKDITGKLYQINWNFNNTKNILSPAKVTPIITYPNIPVKTIDYDHNFIIGIDENNMAFRISGLTKTILKGDKNSNIVDISGGQLSTLILNSSGEIYSVKDDSSIENIPIGSDQKWISINCGEGYNFAINDKRELYSWGSNLGGLGLGPTPPADINTKPYKVSNNNNWRGASAGHNSHGIVCQCSNSITHTPTPSPTPSPTPTITPSKTSGGGEGPPGGGGTPTGTATPTPTPTPSPDPTPSPTPTPTETPDPTNTPSPNPTNTPSPSPTDCNPYCDMDVVFLIDITGSMGAVIDDVKKSVDQIVDLIETRTANSYRLGLVTIDEGNLAYYATSPTYINLPSDQKYVKSGTSSPPVLNIYLTCLEKMSMNNKASFKDQLLKLNTTNFPMGTGWNTPEPSDIAVDITADGFAGIFRQESSVAKIIIIITDAPPAGTDDEYDSTDISDINNKLVPKCLSKDIQVYLMTDYRSNALYDLATKTGGGVKGLTAVSIIDIITTLDCYPPPTPTIPVNCCISDTQIIDLCPKLLGLNSYVQFSELLINEYKSLDELDVDKIWFDKIASEGPNSVVLSTYGEFPDTRAKLLEINSDLNKINGIAIGPDTTLKIYSDKNFTGSLLLNISGPALINNHYYQDTYIVDQSMTLDYSDSSLQETYPQSVRYWSSNFTYLRMSEWINGSFKIEQTILEIQDANIPTPTVDTCKIAPTPTPGGAGCFMHMSGAVLGGENRPELNAVVKIGDPSPNGSVTLPACNLVINGDYPDAALALPNATKYTFDSIAIGPDTSLIFYGGKNFTGQILLSMEGPAVIWNTIWKGTIYQPFFDNNYSDPILQATYPQSRRFWSVSNMHLWQDGSFKISCSPGPTSTPYSTSPQNPTPTPSPTGPTPTPSSTGPTQTPTGPTPTPSSTGPTQTPTGPTPTPSSTGPTQTPTSITPTPTPTGITPTPTPSSITPTPTPTIITPTPTPSQITPTPTPTLMDITPSGVTPTPTPTEIIPTPTPTEIIPTPTPSQIIPTPIPTTITSTPTPTIITPTPTPSQITPTPTPSSSGPTPTPTCYTGLYWRNYENNRYWTNIDSNYNGEKLIASAFESPLMISNNGGKNWNITNTTKNWSCVASSADFQILVAGVWGGKIYISRDYGNSWSETGYDKYWSGLAISDDGLIVYAITNNDKIYVSIDSGYSWSSKESERLWTGISCSSDGSKAYACAYDNQIFISTNSGSSWIGNEFYKPWKNIDCSSNGMIIAAVTLNDKIYISIDGGMTFIDRNNNKYWNSVSVSPDGDKIIASTESDRLYISKDIGFSWTEVGDTRNWTDIIYIDNLEQIIGLSYNDKIYISNCYLDPTPTPTNTPLCTGLPITLADPYLPEFIYDSILPPSIFKVLFPKEFKITVDQNECRVKPIIDTHPCYNANFNFCNINFDNIIDIDSLPKTAFLEEFTTTDPILKYQLEQYRKSLGYAQEIVGSKIYIDIDCATNQSNPKFLNYTKFELIYQPTDIEALPCIDGYVYDTLAPGVPSIRLFSANSSKDIRNWIRDHFRFIRYLIKAPSYNDYFKYNDLYWIYDENSDTVYINIIPS